MLSLFIKHFLLESKTFLNIACIYLRFKLVKFLNSFKLKLNNNLQGWNFILFIFKGEGQIGRIILI